MEMENRRVKWLCYWRPEFAIRHQCNGRQLLLIEVEDEDNEEAKVETEPEREAIVKEPPQIYIHAISGILHCSTMKFEGVVKNKRFELLIDFGNTRKFLDVDLAKQWGVTPKKSTL